MAMLDDPAVARRDKRGSGADNPGSRLHGGSGEARTAGGEVDTGCGADKDGDDVDAAENAMELQMMLAYPRGEIDGADQESENSGKCVRNQEAAVGDDLQTVGVIHRIVGNKKNFGCDEDEERGES